MTRRLVLLDIVVLFSIGVPWLAVPAFLEAIQAPFSEVASTSISLMAVVMVCAFIWSFVIRGKVEARTGSPTGPGEGRIAYLAFLGFFWSLIDDGPVDFDSVSTWPEVTSGLQHTITEVVLHLLTAAFMYLTVREALNGKRVASRKALQISILTLAAFWAAYFQNTPLEIVQRVAQSAWYPLDIVEHALSLALFYLAIRTCTSS